TVYVTILGGAGSIGDHSDRAAIRDCLGGVKTASGFVPRHLAKILTIRHIPDLIFNEDNGLANDSRARELLKEVERRHNSRTTDGSIQSGAASSGDTEEN